MNDLNFFPKRLFVWVIAGIVNEYRMAFLYKSFSKVLSKLFKSAISIRDTATTKNANFHEYFKLPWIFLVTRKYQEILVMIWSMRVQSYLDGIFKPIRKLVVWTEKL